jgi:peptidylprolyl isomerase
LAERIHAPEASVRARAALALGSVQGLEAVPDLVEALADESAGVRRDVAFALGQAGAADAVGPLTDAFEGEADPEVRRRIIEALGKLATLEAVDALMALSADPAEEADRVLALSRLGAVGGVATPPGLERILESLEAPDPAVRANAAYFFGRIRPARPWSPHADRVRAALEGYARDDPAGMYLVQGLGRLGESTDAELVRRWAVAGRDWRTRANAMAALAGGWRVHPETSEVLVAGLDDPSPQVAVAAAQALAQGPVAPSLARRVQANMEADPGRLQVIRPLLGLMANMDERDFVYRWADALEPDDASGWSAVVAAIAELRGDDALERLIRAAEAPWARTTSDAMAALARRWPRDRRDPGVHPVYLGVLSRAVRSANSRTVYIAAPVLADSALVRLGSVDTLVSVYRSLSLPDDSDAVTAVLGALASTGSPEVELLMEEAAGAPHPEVRRAAEASLAALRGEPGGRDSGPQAPPPVADHSELDTDVPLDWDYLAALGRAPRLVLETEWGRIVALLATEDAPQTVQTVARFAEEGRYDGVPFHRVVPNFVIQGGDFDSGDGRGGAGFSITSEFTLIPYARGVIGMASAGKDTEGSQFFITHSMQPHLDGGYTAFGWVVEGMDVVDRILAGERIRRASVERDG